MNYAFSRNIFQALRAGAVLALVLCTAFVIPALFAAAAALAPAVDIAKFAFAPKEIGYWVPPAPKKLIDPRPNVALAAKSADILVTTDGLVYVTDWNAGLNVLQYEG